MTVIVHNEKSRQKMVHQNACGTWYEKGRWRLSDRWLVSLLCFEDAEYAIVRNALPIRETSTPPVGRYAVALDSRQASQLMQYASAMRVYGNTGALGWCHGRLPFQYDMVDAGFLD